MPLEDYKGEEAKEKSTFVVINRQLAIPAKNVFLEAPLRSIHVHLKIISAQTGGLYVFSKCGSAIY